MSIDVYPNIQIFLFFGFTEGNRTLKVNSCSSFASRSLWMSSLIDERDSKKARISIGSSSLPIKFPAFLQSVEETLVISDIKEVSLHVSLIGTHDGVKYSIIILPCCI